MATDIISAVTVGYQVFRAHQGGFGGGRGQLAMPPPLASNALWVLIVTTYVLSLLTTH